MPEEEETNLTLPDGRKLDELRVSDLKKELESRGLNKSGVKKDLVQRLAESLTNSGDGLTPEKSVDEESKSPQAPSATSDKIDVSNNDSLIEHEQITVSEPTEVEVNGVQEAPADNATGDCDASQAAEEPPPTSKSPSPPKPVEPTEEVQPPSPVISRPPIPRLDSTTTEMEAEEEDYEDENMDAIPPPPPPAPEPVPASEPAGAEAAASQPHDAPNHHQSADGLAKSPALAVKPPAPATSPTSSKPPKETRGIGYLAEGPERIEPAGEHRHPPTELVYIRFLMRPFTAGQLNKMIESQFGKVCELWLDKIKSSAVVRMETQEAAKSCREGIDGCRWPSINPRILRCDFASEALLDWLKEHGDSGDRNPPRHLLIGAPPPAAPEKAEGRVAADKSSQRKRTSSGDKPSSRTAAGAHADRRHRLAEETPAAKADGSTASKSEEPSKALDDLFKKTTAAPCIYWLPLSDEEAAAQTKRRQERYIAENTRRAGVSSRRNQGGDTREARSPFAESDQKPPARQSPESTAGTRGAPPAEDRKGAAATTARQDRSPFPAKRQRSPPSVAPKRRSRSPAQQRGGAGNEESRPVKRRRDSPPPASAAADERSRRRRESSGSLDRRRAPRR